MKKIMIFLLFCSISYTQTVDKKTKDHMSLANTQWKVMSIKDKIIPQKLKLTMFFGAITDNKAPVSGFSGCNNFVGHYYLTESKKSPVLGFTQFASTRMACLGEEANTTEIFFLETLQFVQTYFIYKDKLNLQTVDKKIVVVLVPNTKDNLK